MLQEINQRQILCGNTTSDSFIFAMTHHQHIFLHQYSHGLNSVIMSLILQPPYNCSLGHSSFHFSLLPKFFQTMDMKVMPSTLKCVPY